MMRFAQQNIEKEVKNEETRYSRQRAMPEYQVLPLIYNRLDPSDRQIKFICKLIKAHAVNHSPVHYPAVTLICHPFGYQIIHLAAGYLRKLVHLRFLRLTRLVPLLLPVLRVRVTLRVVLLVVTLICAIVYDTPVTDIISVSTGRTIQFN